VKKVVDADIGHGRRLQVHELRPPENASLLSLMERGRAAMERGETEEAAEAARAVWRRARGDPFAGLWCGQMLARYGRREEAVEVYCVTERLPRGSWEAYWSLGRFLTSGVGDHARAIDLLTEAVRIEPRAVDAHLDLARCLKALGRLDEAQEHLTEALRLDPSVKL
jgi:protein O-GlcNAc transferase